MIAKADFVCRSDERENLVFNFLRKFPPKREFFTFFPIFSKKSSFLFIFLL